MSIIYTDKEKCTGCYACVRNCIAKAIRVREGIAEVMKQRCITCGACLQVCTPKAKQAESDIGIAWQLLAQYPNVIAILSSSFPAALPEIRPGQLVTAIKGLGFSEVMEVAFGAELVGRKYARLLSKDKDRSNGSIIHRPRWSSLVLVSPRRLRAATRRSPGSWMPS